MSHIRTFRVTRIQRQTPDAVVIDFQVADGEAVSFIPGQFLTLRIPIEGKKINRSYSLCSSPDELPTLSVAVKQIHEGLISRYLNQELREGDIVEAVEPMGNFVLKPDADASRPVILFGAGSGITPLFSILKTCLKQESHSMVSLIYANENESSIIFRNELEDLKNLYSDRLRVIHILKNPEGACEFTGLPNTTLLLHLLGTIPDAARADAQFYMCGPEGFMQVVKQTLADAMIPAARIHKESFTTTPPAPDAAPPAGTATIVKRTVKVIMDQKEYSVEVNPDETVLFAALDDNIDLPYSCQGGVCTACRGKIEIRKMHLDEREGLSDAELNEGYVLTCVGHPLTDDVVIEIG